MYMYMCIYVYTYIYVYIFTHTHTQYAPRNIQGDGGLEDGMRLALKLIEGRQRQLVLRTYHLFEVRNQERHPKP